jgi:hypothetical protein
LGHLIGHITENDFDSQGQGETAERTPKTHVSDLKASWSVKYTDGFSPSRGAITMSATRRRDPKREQYDGMPLVSQPNVYEVVE